MRCMNTPDEQRAKAAVMRVVTCVTLCDGRPLCVPPPATPLLPPHSPLLADEKALLKLLPLLFTRLSRPL